MLTERRTDSEQFLPTPAEGPFFVGDELYMHWAVRNDSEGPVDQPFRVGIMLDGEVVYSRRISGLDAQDDTRGLNTLIQVDFPGLHTLALIVDLDNDVAESSEDGQRLRDRAELGGADADPEAHVNTSRQAHSGAGPRSPCDGHVGSNGRSGRGADVDRYECPYSRTGASYPFTHADADNHTYADGDTHTNDHPNPDRRGPGHPPQRSDRERRPDRRLHEELRDLCAPAG